MIIKVTVDVTKIEKARLKEREYSVKGETHKAKNLELILIPTQKGNSHYMVAQGKERDEDVQMPIIGNANELGEGAKPPRQSNAAKDFARQDAEADMAAEEDVPF